MQPAPEPVAPADIRRLVVGCDHTGVALKKRIVDWCRGRGLAVVEAGAADATPVDRVIVIDAQDVSAPAQQEQ